MCSQPCPLIRLGFRAGFGFLLETCFLGSLGAGLGILSGLRFSLGLGASFRGGFLARFNLGLFAGEGLAGETGALFLLVRRIDEPERAAPAPRTITGQAGAVVPAASGFLRSAKSTTINPVRISGMVSHCPIDSPVRCAKSASC